MASSKSLILVHLILCALLFSNPARQSCLFSSEQYYILTMVHQHCVDPPNRSTSIREVENIASVLQIGRRSSCSPNNLETRDRGEMSSLFKSGPGILCQATSVIRSVREGTSAEIYTAVYIMRKHRGSNIDPIAHSIQLHATTYYQ